MPLRQLFPPIDSPANSAKVDIIAVHGLNPRSKKDADHAWDTWRTPPGPGGRLWLRDDLPRHLPNARILLYQYNATAVYGRDRDTFLGKANELLEAIRVERDDDGEPEVMLRRPIIFLCHSMGGLLVKQALINAHNNPKYTPIKVATSGIAFFATPHNGGDQKLVSLGKVASGIAMGVGFQKGDGVVEVLKSGGMFADTVREQWHHQVDGYNIVSFWGGLDKVVPRESARLGLPGDRENIVKLDADHSGVCKFGLGKIDQDNLKLVCGNIKDLVRSALKTGDPSPSRHGSGCVSRPQYLVPSLRNKNFTGRSTILDDLQQKLFIRKGCQKLAVVGLGGVGKTQVALQFAHWVRENQPEYSVFWVPALSVASFTQAYSWIWKTIGVPTNDDEDDPKELVQKHLSSEEAGKWLLIIDNADDAEVLFGSSDGAPGVNEWLPESEAGLTLFTTRIMEIGTAVATTDVVELREMDAQEAVGFLTKSLIRKQLVQDEAMTTALLLELTHLPLAITQAAAYLNRNSQLSIARYLELLRGTEQDMVSLMSREFQDNTRYRGSQNAVATTWLVSFEQIQKFDAVAANLLSFISCIEPKAIPRSVLPQTQPQEETEFAIGTLSGYAFLARREGDDDEVYDMHSLVHLATRIWIQKQERTEETTVSAVHHLWAVFPAPPDPANRRVWQAYFPHAFRLLDASSMYQFEERFDLAYRVGRCLQTDRRFKAAVPYFEETVAWKREHRDVTDADRLACEHTLANAYLDVSRVKDAIRILEHVVQVEKAMLDEEDRNRLLSECALASAYLDDRQVNRAIQILEHVVKVDKRILDEGDHYRLSSEHSLATAYLDDERVEDAIRILEHVVEVEGRIIDQENYDLLTSTHQLAKAYLKNGQVEDATRILEHVVQVWRKTLHEEDRQRVSAEHNLAYAYAVDKRFEDAIRILEHVVKVKERMFHKEDLTRCASEHTLAYAYLYGGRVEDAIRIMEHVVATREALLAEDDFDLLASKELLEEAYEMMKRGGSVK